MIIILFSLLLFSTTATTQALATHCPGCDTTAPDYNSSAWDRRYDSGKYQEGNGQYPRSSSTDPYQSRESNVQRYNREQRQQEEQRQDNRRDSSGDSRETQRDSSRGYSGGYYGVDTCRSSYGAC